MLSKRSKSTLVVRLDDIIINEADRYRTSERSSCYRGSLPRFTTEARKANQAIVDRLGTIAEQKNASTAQVTPAWLLALKPWVVPLPTTPKYRSG